jgi:hypothetical protein
VTSGLCPFLGFSILKPLHLASPIPRFILHPMTLSQVYPGPHCQPLLQINEQLFGVGVKCNMCSNCETLQTS